MFGFLKRKRLTMTEVEELYAVLTRWFRVALFTELHRRYEAEMDGEKAKILAGQVVNFVMGEGISELQEIEEPLKRSFTELRGSMEIRAFRELRADRLLRELIVSTLRIRAVLEFHRLGKSFSGSLRQKQIDVILEEFGVEFPREVEPTEYAALMERYRRERDPLTKRS